MVFGGVEIAFLNLLRNGGAAHIVANSSLNPEKLSSSSNRNLPIPDQKHQDEILLFTGLQKLQNQARTVKEKIEETLENSH